METVLVIEDDEAIQELVLYNLEREGLKVIAAPDGPEGLEKAITAQPDVILLDLMLPGMSGYEVCRCLRADAKTARIPIIILSARGDIIDKVLGLELGADDYMTKPFSPRELSARIRARLRRDRVKMTTEQNKIVIGELELWPQGFSVTLSGQRINLTVKEFELLYLLISYPRQVFTREVLLEKIWGYHVHGDTRTVDVHISTIRGKLKSLGSLIESVRGVGYRFVPQEEKN